MRFPCGTSARICQVCGVVYLPGLWPKRAKGCSPEPFSPACMQKRPLMIHPGMYTGCHAHGLACAWTAKVAL